MVVFEWMKMKEKKNLKRQNRSQFGNAAAPGRVAAEEKGRTQTPSCGLRHPSLEEGAGKRCSECGSDLYTELSVQFNSVMLKYSRKASLLFWALLIRTLRQVLL